MGPHKQTENSHKNSFFFSKRTNDLIFQGWTPTTDNQFILAFICIVLAALLMEAGRRVTRELHRKISQIDKQLHVQSSQHSVTAAPLLSSPPEANGSSLYSSKKTVNRGRDATIPFSKELNDGNQTKKTAKVWEMNQEGFLQLKTKNTNCSNMILSTDGQSYGNGAGHTSVISRQDSQVASLKRNLSFDLSGNRWDTSAAESCHLDNEKVVSMSDRRKLDLKRLLFHSLVTVSHVGQVVMGYILMLVVMSYNVWLLLAVLTGAAFGYLIFSWDRIILNTTSYSRVPRVEAVLTSSV